MSSLYWLDGQNQDVSEISGFVVCIIILIPLQAHVLVKLPVKKRLIYPKTNYFSGQTVVLQGNDLTVSVQMKHFVDSPVFTECVKSFFLLPE